MSDQELYENAYGDLQVVKLLKQEKIEDVASLFESLDSKWDQRYFYSSALSRNLSLGLIKSWIDSEPDSPNGYLVFGARLMHWAWQARGYGFGSNVANVNWREFFRRLEYARHILLSAAERYPEDPTPWVYLIMVAVYRGDDHQQEVDYFEQVLARDSENWPGHMHMLTAYSKKYGGSHEVMLEFARDAAKSHGDGSVIPAIVLKAHSEIWKYLVNFEDDAEAGESYRHDKEVVAEAVQAYEASLGSANYRETKYSLFARYNAAGWFWIVDDKARLREQFKLLGTRICDAHWRWVGVEGELKKAQKWAKQ